MHTDPAYTGPTIHEWQSLVQLAAKLEAQPAHVINAIDRGQRCMGYYLTRRDVTAQDNLTSLGLDARTKTLYRVARFEEQMDRILTIEVKITSRLRELRRIDLARTDQDALAQINGLTLQLYTSLGLLRRTRARIQRCEQDADAGQQALL